MELAPGGWFGGEAPAPLSAHLSQRWGEAVSRDAAGKPVYARYNIQLESEPVATETAATLTASLPAA